MSCVFDYFYGRRKNRNFAVCNPFDMFTQLIKFYTFYYHLLKSIDVWKRWWKWRQKMNGCSFQRVLRKVGFCLKILCYLQNEKIWVILQNYGNDPVKHPAFFKLPLRLSAHPIKGGCLIGDCFIWKFAFL